MNIPTRKLLKAVSRKRARGGPSGSQRAPTPKRPTARPPAPPAPRGSPVAPEIDLTADTPPEGAASIEAPREEAAAERPKVPGEPMAGELATEAEPRISAPSGPLSPEAPRSWGEGPSRAASSPPEQALVRSPPVESGSGRGAEGSGTRPGLSRDSVHVDGQWAEQVLLPALAPEIWEGLGQLNSGAFFRESYAALVKLANSLRAAREVMHEGKALVRESRKEADEASARAEAAEGALEMARTARAEEIKAAEDRADAEAGRLRAVLRQMAVAENAVAARDLHISELTSAIQTAEGTAAEATGRAKVEEERAKAAEERARAAEERANAEEKKAKIAEREAERAREAENAAVAALAAEEGARAVEAEATAAARTVEIVEEYKASERFTDDLAEASADVFLRGFRHGQEKVARDFNFPQALEVEPDDNSDAASSDDESAPTGP